MLSALVEAAQRFRSEGKLPPSGYKPKTPKWIINLDSTRITVEGPYGRRDIRPVPAPDRQRSAKVTERNLKPFLLIDDARYALGSVDSGGDALARLRHNGFKALLSQAHDDSGIGDLGTVLDFLNQPGVGQLWPNIDSRDLVAFRVGGRYPTENLMIQRFWSRYLAREVEAKEEATCGICGREAKPLLTFPREITVMGQKCQISSFNCEAFRSFGREQTTNAPVCFDCASEAIDAADYLIRHDQHRQMVLIVKNKSIGRIDSLRSQTAIFWLKRPFETPSGPITGNFEELLSGFLERAAQPSAPPPQLSQLEALLEIPWTGKETPLNLADNRFYLALLSANKGRLVCREWLDVSLDRVKGNLKWFLDASRIVGPWGEQPRAFPVPAFLSALASENPNLTRSLLRTAFQGHPPPHGLMEAALSRLRIPNVLANADLLHPLAALLKLTLTHGKGEASRMERVDDGRTSEAYLCGRLLAVIAEAQRRASRNLGTTLVERFYGATSTAPKAYLGLLLKLMATAYLPKLRKEGGYHAVMTALEALTANDRLTPETLPTSLSLTEQAEFALGFYQQQAEFRAQRAARSKRLTTQAGDQK
jgi:CRISPR-associated protein Csd1